MTAGVRSDWIKAMHKNEWDALMRGVVEGDQSSKEQLRAYARAVIHSFLAPLIAGKSAQLESRGVSLEGLTQKATLDAMELLGRTESSVPIQSEERFRGFLHDLAGDAFRQCFAEASAPRTAAPRPPLPAPADEAPAHQDLNETLHRLVSHLPRREAEVMHFYLAGQTYEQIAGRLGLHRSNVSRLLHQARERLRELLLRDEEPLTLTESGLSQKPEEVRLTPELREWALRQFTEEEVVAGLRELREKGGLELKDFLPELERIVEHGSEPTQ